MNRREWLKSAALLGGAAALSGGITNNLWANSPDDFSAAAFGNDFLWGVSAAAYQIEGAYNEDGKGENIWDRFTHKGKCYKNATGDVACDFYHRYADDLQIVKQLNVGAFRTSVAWSRILPNGTGAPNQKGIDFYNRMIDKSLELGIQPCLTLYHWDLPQALQDKGGWMNRDIVGQFCDYTNLATKSFGDRVKTWYILNEPLAFTLVGHLVGYHAPGKVGIGKFLKTIHNAALCLAEGSRVAKTNVPDANVGSTFSCAHLTPKTDKPKDALATKRMDALINRLYFEPALGLGYPTKDLPWLTRIEKYMKEGDEAKLKANLDSVGLQNYTREVVKKMWYLPLMHAMVEKAEKRGVPTTAMGWEIYPESIYQTIKQFSGTPNCPPIYITENGIGLEDKREGDAVHDPVRTNYLKDYLKQVLRAKNEGADVRGYFVWSLMDNFEWHEGYRPRFGLVYIDYTNQQRVLKDSAKWFAGFLAGK